MILNITKLEREYLTFIIKGDLETLTENEEELDQQIDHVHAERLLNRLELLN
jgi:hypothetical protein